MLFTTLAVFITLQVLKSKEVRPERSRFLRWILHVSARPAGMNLFDLQLEVAAALIMKNVRVILSR